MHAVAHRLHHAPYMSRHALLSPNATTDARCTGWGSVPVSLQAAGDRSQAHCSSHVAWVHNRSCTDLGRVCFDGLHDLCACRAGRSCCALDDQSGTPVEVCGAGAAAPLGPRDLSHMGLDEGFFIGTAAWAPGTSYNRDIIAGKQLVLMVLGRQWE